MAHDVGVIEGFFGPEWSWENRNLFCETLRAFGGDFYIYAPKRDSYLRKNWQQDHPAEMWRKLQVFREKCRALQIGFGVGLSPFEIHEHWDQKTRDRLREKILKLQELDLQYLGLFFDDMRGAPDLADKQAEIVEFVRNVTKLTLFFCPTYYSDDRILDKVFGERPTNYLEKIGREIASDVRIFWTGNKVISPNISAADLETVAKVLKRKPLIWDNFFANDGPRQCKFLSLKPFEGRSREALEASSGWVLNLMNQPSLSEILLVSSLLVMRKNLDPAEALQTAAEKLAGSDFAKILNRFSSEFTVQGLDKISDQSKTDLREMLTPSNRFAQEIQDWLDGKYIVGPECLTD